MTTRQGKLQTLYLVDQLSLFFGRTITYWKKTAEFNVSCIEITHKHNGRQKKFIYFI